MEFKEIMTDIKKDELKTVYLLYGKEMYLKDIILSEIKKKYLDSSFETLNYSYMDGKIVTQEEIINASETLPFMSEKKLVVVEDLNMFKGSSKGESSEKERISNTDDILSEYVNNINESTCLVFIWNGEKIDNRKKIVKNIKKTGRIIELDRLKGDELEKWIARQFKNKNKKINRNEISYFLLSMNYLDRNTEKTLYDLENEIKKLSNYVGDRENIRKEDIDKTKPKSLENDIFKLVDYISQKNSSLVIELFNEMILDGEAPQMIMYMVIRQIRLLLATKLLRERGYDIKAIGQKINVYHDFIIKKLISQSNGFSESELIIGMKKCRDIDKSIKTGRADAKLELEILMIELSKN